MTILALLKLLMSGSEDLSPQDQRMIPGKTGLAEKLQALSPDVCLKVCVAPCLPVLNYSYSKERFRKATAKRAE
jgi:hypothetical protein